MSFLINADKPISNAGDLQQQGAKYSLIAEADYPIPAVWLMFFNQDDFVESKLKYQNGVGEAFFTSIELPCTSVEQARNNIEASHAYFSEVFDCPEVALGYLNKTIEFFTQLDYEYLILDASAYLLMNFEEDQWPRFKQAFSRDQDAKEQILEFTGYVEGIAPYPIDEFYSNPELDNPGRIANSNALNPNFFDIDRRIKFPTEPQATSAISNKPTATVNKKWWAFWK